MTLLANQTLLTDRIAKIETLIVDLPTIRGHQLSMTTMTTQSSVIVKIYTEGGVLGLGEAATIGGLSYGPESPEGMQLTIDQYIAPLLIGQSIASIKALKVRMAQNIRGNYFAKNAVETALFDIQGKILNVPISTLLGGKVQDRLSVLWVLASGDTEKDILEAKEMIASGRHKDFKLKIGRRPVKEDVAHVIAIKAALGDESMVTVDVNQAWSEAEAIEGMQLLQDAGIDLVEQPLAQHEIAAQARLSERFNIPILADESVGLPYEGFNIAKIAGARAFALKTAKSGGMLGVLALAEIAQAAGIGLYGGTMLEGSIATSAAVQAYSTLPTLEWGTELFSPLLLKDDIVIEPLQYHNYGVEVSDKPGLGMALDEDKVNFYRRK
ncbi:muconate cycloisomerase [Ignatzschineria indica]|uniref:Muconate cycloisomerase n=1 Tax=Ignatzschineria indica TaxID=472583 RepID=A0A2U2AK74_9GAMM|nr:muconate/chloromuconate family cycloisomerase [Ignatzschineria indica]PWD83223.1 muconate cycloisomerase [Ignatzschineria indica]GGZ81994.1 muconate cycloisomerase [Ignatzschineria indica]